MQNKRFSAGTGLLLIAVLFITAIALANVALRGWRADFTENQLFTLSEGTKNLVAKLEEPITLRFYFSKGQAQDIPPIRSYGQRVEEMLEEFVELNRGKLSLKVVDPEPFSVEEDEATGFGLQGAPLDNQGTKLYFGLAGTNSIGDQAQIGFFQNERESFLEYEIAKLIYELANPKKPVIGVLGALPVLGKPEQGQPRWMALQQLENFFEVAQLENDLTEVPEEVEVLLAVHPKELPESTLYAIDQFVMKGGRAAFFTDPNAEQDKGDELGGSFRNSDVNKLISAWGLEQELDKFVADPAYALQITDQRSGRLIRHLAILGLEAGAFNRDDVVTAELQSINASTAGYFNIVQDDSVSEEEQAEALNPMAIKTKAGTTVQPVILSSEDAMAQNVNALALMNNAEQMFSSYQPGGEALLMAARIAGDAPSAFGDAAPEGLDAGSHKATSDGPINVFVMADTDVLSDRLWVQIQNFLGQQIANAFANNGDLLVNLMDNLGGSSDLINVRSRGNFSRPFDYVIELRRKAEERFRDKETELEAELKETERQLAELQTSTNDQNQLVINLTPEQQQAVKDFQAEQIRVRKELREVRHKLDSDIEDLGTVLKAINIAAVPALLMLFALISGLRRRQAAA